MLWRYCTSFSSSNSQGAFRGAAVEEDAMNSIAGLRRAVQYTVYTE
jgi:hypothetical protein